MIEDNGSGLMTADNAIVLAEEPRITASLGKDVDVLCCSADKLLGSVQAGILLGRAEHIAAMRRNPLYRVLRLDKVRMALLSRTLRLYLAGRSADVPLWHAFHATIDELGCRADQLRPPAEGSRWAGCRRVPVRSKLGGGSNPEADFESLGLELEHRDLSAEEVNGALPGARSRSSATSSTNGTIWTCAPSSPTTFRSSSKRWTSCVARLREARTRPPVRRWPVPRGPDNYVARLLAYHVHGDNDE